MADKIKLNTCNFVW